MGAVWKSVEVWMLPKQTVEMMEGLVRNPQTISGSSGNVIRETEGAPGSSSQ